MKFLYFVLLLPLLVFSQVPVDINSGNPAFPFPQFLAYEYEGNHRLGNLGTQNPDGLVHAEMEKRISEAWLIMANRFIYDGDSHAGVQYIKSNEGCPYDCSEGAGYAMIGAAYMGDKTSFDGVWFREHDLRMVKQPRYIDGITSRPDYKYGEFALAEPGGDSAADGDVDIALGLLMAWRQWGDDSGYIASNGDVISYKQDALNVIRGLVERQNQGFGDCRSVSGIIGFDGYIKGGNTWKELTDWADDPVMCPEFAGPTDQHVDYVAPAYFKAFANFLETEGEGDQEDIDWHIPQLERAEVSSDWFMGELYDQGPNTIPVAGWVGLDNSNNATFSNFQDGEDFRYAWRTILNHTWHGNPDVSWNPDTHQVIDGGNSFNFDMGARFSEFMNDPSIAGNGCKTPGTGMSFNGPSQLVQFYNPNTGLEGSTFPLNWLVGTGSPSAVSAQDFDLMGKLYRQCAIEWDQTSGQNLDSVPKYFHGFFRLLGMLITTGNFQSPMSIEPEANIKIYSQVDKTFSFTNDVVTYTFSYRNYGSIDATNTVITDVIPEGLEFVSATNGGVLSGTSITWNVGTVAGFKSVTPLEDTKGEVSVTFKVKEAFSGIVCNPVTIETTSGTGWTSNDFPNVDSEVMQRNCIDIVEKALEIEKTVNHEEVNPGDVVTYTVDFKNSSQGGYINGGRSGVNFSYARGNQDALGDTQGLKIRLFHGADEPYIDYQNYRVSVFLNDNVYKCIQGEDGCATGWALRSNVYEGGDSAGVIVSQEDIVPGFDDGGKWNQRVIVQFAEQLSGPTPHLLRYAGLTRNHEGGDFPLRGVWQLYTSNNGDSDWSDDWSWDADASDSDGGFYYPVTNDWTDPDNPDQLVDIYHNEACDKPTKTVDNVLIEEWDGYTWRRIYGSGPVPGRDVENVVFRDVLPDGFEFVEFVGDSPLGIDPVVTTENGRSVITWETDLLQIGQDVQIVYKAIAGFSEGKTCSTADEIQTNLASVAANNEAPLETSVDVLITCNPVILPPAPSSMVKEVSPISAEVGEEVVYTLSYKNEDGSPIQVPMTNSSDWTAQEGTLMSIGGGTVSNGSNSVQVTTYNNSHGTNGSLEATIDFEENAQFGFALRHTGGDVENGLYVVFKPGPTTMQISLYDGTNLLETTEQGTPGSNTEIKVLLNEGDLNVWLGDISSPSPSWVASGLPIRVGNYGFINGTPSGGDNWGTHTVTSFYSAMDSAFNVQITDPIPGELSFVSSTEGENIDGVVTFPLLPGPVLAGAEISYEWTAEIVSCPSDLLKIENIAYTNIFGIEENSIAAQAILDCSGLDLCGDAPEVPLLTDGDEVLICSGDVAGINAEDYVETTSADFELIWFDGPSKFDNEIDAPVVDGDEVGEKVYYVAQIADVVCGEGDRIAITFVVGDGAEGVTEEITIESGESVGFDVASELGYEVGNIQWTASESLNIEGESTTTITDDTITDVLINTSGTDQIVEYSIEELSSSDCGKGISTLIVTVTSALCDIVVPEVINADYCLSQEVTETLDFYIETEGTITWYADNEETSAAITMPSVDTSLSGETIYYVSQVIDDCESERVEFKVTVQEIKSAFNDEITIDSGDTLNYDLLALGLIDQAVSWSAINNENITGETLTSINGNTIIDTLVNTSDVDQVVIYTIIETTTDGCQRENSTITVTITAPLCLTEAPEVESVEYCLNEVITDTIDSYVTADGTVLWYADNELTSTAITMPTIDTSLSGEITYYVSQVIDGCESERVEILVKENEGNSGVIQHTEVILSNESLLFDIPIETGLIAGSFEWSASVDSNITGNTISISNEIVITDTLINDSNFDRQIEYTITPFDCNEAIHVLTVTIRTLPSVELNTSAVVEGDDLQVELIFSKPTVSETTIVIGINPGTVNGVSTDDISLEDVTLVIPAGVEDFSFAIPTIDDDLSEPSENLEISIKSVEPENLTNFSEIVEVAIIDNDGLPSILIDDIEILEGETKAVNIRLSNPSSEDITITVSLVFTNDTTTDRDFELLDQDSITVSFLAGETEPITQTNIRAIDDSIPEGDQVLIVSVATVDNGVLNDSTDTAEITIIDDDLAPTIIIDDDQVNEGDTIEIPIYLRSPALDRIELLVSFRDDDTDGDFDATRQLVVFEAGSRVPNTPLEVEIFQDSIPENDEDFIAFIAIGDIIQGTVNFGGFIGLDSGIITIQDDDVDVDIILSEVVLEEGETKEIPISLSDPSTEDITITLLIENGTTTDTDYVVSSVEVTFLAGSTLPDSPVTILATDDILEEEDELLVVSVFSVNTGTINDSSDTAQIIIENKDGSEEEEVPLPECVVITNPIPGATNISLSPRITWEEDVNATAYFISVGTSPNGTDIVATQNVGDNTTYFIPFDLENDTDYYISITPNNADGLSPIDSCASEIFRTKEAIEVSKTKYGLSPDGDGINEFWMIDDIENYPNNEVLIYNRWGNLVFRTINYDNNFNVFSGIANQQTNLGAGDLLSGTYFYEIKIDGEHDFTNLKGFLVLKR